MNTTFYLAVTERWFNMPEISTDLTTGVIQVTFDANFILSLTALIGSLAVAVWGIMRFLINRADIDKKHINDKLDEHVKALHDRVDKVRDEYAKKDDIDKELERIHQSIADSRNQVTVQIQSVNARLDSIMNALHVRRN